MVEPQRDGGDRAPFARGATPDGKFVRLRTSAMGQKTYQGDYLGLTENHAIVKMLYKQGDQNVLFADTVAKLNRTNRIVNYLLVLSERALYLVDRDTFRLTRRVALKSIESLHLSDLADHFLVIMVPEEESDLVLVSTRKSEIVTELAEAVKLTGRELEVKFGNEIQYSVDRTSTRELTFSPAQGGISTRINIV